MVLVDVDINEIGGQDGVAYRYQYTIAGGSPITTYFVQYQSYDLYFSSTKQRIQFPNTITPTDYETGNGQKRPYFIFDGITIPMGSTIEDATLTFNIASNTGLFGATWTGKVYGRKTASPTGFTSTSGYGATIFTKPIATAQGTFTVSGAPTSTTETPKAVDVKTVVQELVNTFDYSDDKMMFILKGPVLPALQPTTVTPTTTTGVYANVRAYEGSVDIANLTINYSEGACNTNFCEKFNTYALSKLPVPREIFNYSNKSFADSEWTSQDEPDNQVDVVNENFFFTVKRDGTNTSSTIDLGAPVSDERWTLRAKVFISALTFTTGVGTGAGISIGISDTDSSTGQLSLNNTIAMSLTNAETGGGQAQHVSVDGLNGTLTGTTGSTTAFSASETIYVEIKRLSAREMQTTIYTDANYSVIRDRVIKTISPSITGLRFIRFDSPDDNVVAYDGILTGTIDDIELWDEGTQGDVTFEDDFIQKPQTFFDDFNDGSPWVPTGTGVTVTGGAGRWILPDAINDGALHVDLGVVNDEKWVLRTSLEVVNFTANTDPTPKQVFIGLTDSDGTVTADTAQDGITFRIVTQSTKDKYELTHADGETLFANVVSSVKNITTEFLFIELIRESATKAKVNLYSDSTFTTLIETITATIPATITGLRFIKIQQLEEDGTSLGALDGTYDKVTFYNGVSTLTNWIGTGTSVLIDTGNSRIKATDDSDGTYNAIRTDLVSTSDTNWSLRWKHVFNTITTRTTDPVRLYVGLFDNIGDDDTAQDAVCLLFDEGPSFTVNLRTSDGVALEGASSLAVFTDVPTQGETRFYELKRTSATTVEASAYSDSNYRNLIETVSGTMASTITGTQFLMVKSGNRTDATGVVEAFIDDVEFYNNVSVARTPIEEIKDFEDNFWEDNWTDTSAGISVNTATQVIDWDAKNNNTQVGTVFDLGSPLSDTRWTYRFKLIIDTATSNTTSSQLWMTVSDTATVNDSTAEDYIGMRMVLDGANDSFRIQDSDGIAPGSVVDDVIMSTTLTGNVGIPLYIEIKRTSATTYTGTIYSDPDYQNVIETSNGTCVATTDNLQFIKFFRFASAGTTSDLDGTIDNVQVWDGQDALDHKNVWRDTS